MSFEPISYYFRLEIFGVIQEQSYFWSIFVIFQDDSEKIKNSCGITIFFS